MKKGALLASLFFLFSCASQVETAKRSPLPQKEDPKVGEIKERIDRFYSSLVEKEKRLLIADDPLRNAILHLRYAKDALGRVEDPRVDVAEAMESVSKVLGELEALEVYLKAQDRKESVAYCVITPRLANVREKPSLKAKVIKQAVRGARFRVIERGEEWYAVSLGKGKAYVHSSVCELYFP